MEAWARLARRRKARVGLRFRVMSAETGSWGQSTGNGPDSFVSHSVPLHALRLPDDEGVHVWYLDLGRLGAALRQALPGAGTTDDHHPGAHELRFARRFYLRLLLGAYLGIAGKDVVLVRSPRGKPTLDRAAHPAGLQFSMAKSGDRALVGICVHSPIGVDLEPAGRAPRDALRLARRYFHPLEADDLAALPSGEHDAAFLRAWACKEAVVKASGQGIANQLCRFRIEIDPARPAAVHAIDGDAAAEWALALVRPDEGFVGAIALRRPQLALSCFRLLPAA